MSLSAGHCFVPHTADRIIEAWGPDRAGCFTEALLGLVEGFAASGDARATQVVPIRVGPGPVEDELVALLEEVIFIVDVYSVVPVRFHLGETEGGAIAGDMEVVPSEYAMAVGPVPKGVSYHELSMFEAGGGWRCRVLVDV
jgi:SHS2 domain-containing protein